MGAALRRRQAVHLPGGLPHQGLHAPPPDPYVLLLTLSFVFFLNCNLSPYLHSLWFYCHVDWKYSWCARQVVFYSHHSVSIKCEYRYSLSV